MFKSKVLRYLLIATAVLIVFSIIGRKAGWFGGNKPILVSTEKPEKRTIYEVITSNGKIQPETEVKISADVSGEIVELNVKEGDEVNAGQLLLRIKPDTYTSVRDRAAAAVNTTKANYENSVARVTQTEAQFLKTKLNFERSKKLFEQNTISQAEWEAANADYKVAQAEVEASKQSLKSAEYNVKSSEASLKEAQENLYKTTVYAPVKGIITRLNVEKGERVVGTEMMAGTELLRVADLKRMEVKVDVNENDIVRVSLGDTALVDVDAYLDQKFKGLVTEIANSANTSGQISADQVTSFEVKIILIEASYKHLITKDKPYPFRPGMTANVDIQTECKQNVLSIPIESVTTRADSLLYNNFQARKTKQTSNSTKTLAHNEIVFVNNNGIARVRKVKIGIQDNNFIEIIDGITDKDEVIVAPYSAITRKIKDSVQIKVVKKNQLFGESQ